MILLELLLEFDVAATPHPAHVPAHGRRIPVLVEFPPSGLPDDLDRAELSGGHGHRFRRDDGEPVVPAVPAVGVLVYAAIAPLARGRERPREPGLRRDPSAPVPWSRGPPPRNGAPSCNTAARRRRSARRSRLR